MSAYFDIRSVARRSGLSAVALAELLDQCGIAPEPCARGLLITAEEAIEFCAWLIHRFETPAPPTLEDERVLVTVKEAARLTSLSTSHVYELIRRNELPTVTFGRSRRVPIAALRALCGGAEGARR